MRREPVAVVATSPALLDAAKALAAKIGVTELASVDTQESELLLCMTPERLELRQVALPAPGPVYVDFVSGAVGHRHRFGGGRGQLIAKAVGLKKGLMPSVVDVTAGLGRDAFLLASLGCQVVMVERSPVVAALLHDGMRRALGDADARVIVKQISLVIADSREWLGALDEAHSPEVIYIDPMHPPRLKSAQVKKEMRLFQTLLGGDLDAPALLDRALQVAKKRVVVKQPRYTPPLEGTAPSLTMAGRSTRFDIYLCEGSQN